MKENKIAGKSGGGIAKKARLELEDKTGNKVITNENYLPPAKSIPQLKIKNETVPSIYNKSMHAESGSPQRNLHDGLHPILLKKYAAHLDKVHLKRFKKNEFHARRGELYILAMINDFNDNTQVDNFVNGGPDFKITIKNICEFYLESIVPGDINTQQNSDKLLKSLTSSIYKKKSQYKKWIFKKIIPENNIFVLSIGLYGFDSIFILHWNVLIEHISKLLDNPEMKFISAIILTKNSDQIAMTTRKPFLYNDIRLIHNNFANHPLPPKKLNTYQEYSNRKLINENKNMCLLFEEINNQIVSTKIENWRDCINIENV